MIKNEGAEKATFLDEMAGVGLENITANELSIPYLSMVQPDSQAAVDGATLGVWRNSATGVEYGPVIRVVPLAFKTIWNERENVSPFNTVGRYEPHSIDVTVQQPKGGKGYPKMINPESGNEIQELYVYAVILPDHPEDGVLLFNPTISSMKTCKTWNTLIKSRLLPNGRQMPIFGCIYNLAVDLVDNPQKKGSKMAKFISAQFDTTISEELYSQFIVPKLSSVQSTVLSITQQGDDGSVE